MKTLKYIIIVGLYLLCAGLNAKDLTGVRIYINPGHGGFDAANNRYDVKNREQGRRRP